MTKEQVLTALNNLPDEFEPDELLDKIGLKADEADEIPPDEWEKIKAAIKKGEKDIDEGRFTTHEDLKEQIKTWK